MIDKSNIAELSFDFITKKIEIKLKKPIHVNNFVRHTITKTATFEEYKMYVAKLSGN